MPEIKKQNYLNRDFDTISADIEKILKVYFPEEWQDFNVSSAGMALVDLLAYVSDLLSYYTDKRFNELFLDGVSEPSSAYRLAKTLGYKVPGRKGASTLVDVVVRVPAISTGPDEQYLPLYRPGMRIEGGGQNFETEFEIDFSSDFSQTGVANRTVEPVFDASQNILEYKITKREFCVAGTTTILRKVITEEDSNTAFLEVNLPETNVIEVVDVIAYPTTDSTFNPTYTDYQDFDIKYYEVEHLADNKIFTDENSLNSFASWIEVNRRFTKDFAPDGSCTLTFGSGTPNVDAYAEYLQNLTITNAGEINYNKMFNNTSLGSKLPADHTLFVKYRIGGGESTNIGSRVLGSVSNIDALILGVDAQKNDAVLSSTRATNIIPALGGKGLPSVQEIRYGASSNFAAQERCITLEDYMSRVKQMPGKYGVPFRVGGRVNDNKIQLYIISKDANGKLTEDSTSVLKNNIVEYLSRFRSINDFVEINGAKVINLMFEIDLLTDKSYNANEIRLEALESMKKYFNVDDWEMNQPIYISQLTDNIREIPGVINVVDIKAYNVDGGRYSSTLISQANGPTEFLNNNAALNGNTNNSGARRTLINYIDNSILSTPLSMFEIRYPDTDILVRTS